MSEKFDPAKLEKLNDPGRFETIVPEVIWRALGSPTPRCIVDIGAGTGLFAAKWLELAPEAIVLAADVEPVMLDWMRAHRPEVAHGRIVPIASTEIHLPVDDFSADLVTMVNVHHELVHPDAMLSEAHRVLACGGQVLTVDWAPIESPKGPPLASRFTAEQVAQALACAGFSDVVIHPGLPYHWIVTAVKR